MEKTTQDISREKLVGTYLERSFEALAMYSYWGQKYAAIEKQLAEMQNKIDVASADIRNIEGGADHHTVENRERVKALKRDVDEYEGRIKAAAPQANELFKRGAAFREEGITLMEQAEYLRAFVMKTPEEIEADKKAKVEAKESTAA